MERSEVYKLVDAEREYQDTLWNPVEHAHSVGDFMVLIDVYAARAKTAWVSNDGNQGALNEVRKLTALGIACMEAHGAPARKQRIAGEPL